MRWRIRLSPGSKVYTVFAVKVVFCSLTRNTLNFAEQHGNTNSASFCEILCIPRQKVKARRLSFTRTCAFLLESDIFWTLSGVQGKLLVSILKHLGKMTVPDRPGRYEPRRVKRRRDKYPLLKEPRQAMKNDVKLDGASIQ